MHVWMKICVVVMGIIYVTVAYDWDKVNLPDEHIPYYLNNNPDLKEQCKNDDKCPFKAHLDSEKCWGYEDQCEEKNRMYSPICEGDSKGWTRGKGKEDQIHQFWQQGDFGYVKEHKDQLIPICKPTKEGDSSLLCSEHTRYCKAENLYIDFKNADFMKSRDRFRDNMFEEKEIGGKCVINHDLFKKYGEHESPLQSWYAELKKFTSLDFNPGKTKKRCDVTLTKPTVFIKLDAGVNMFHHFCDYVNLYASQHLNNSFSTDINIVMWDTSQMGYGDFFHATWQAFTDHNIIHLKEYDGKTVCVKDAMFPMLARMRRGLYYNMPLIPGCQNSSLMRAFSQHILHRLAIKQHGPLKNKLRVTLLARNTKYRKVLNQDELMDELRKNPEYEIRVVDYNHKMPFVEQMQSTHDSDIFLGMHGAGLTHMLFLPDWATVSELYNCDDVHCYHDLARLRGLNYVTWTDMSTMEQEDEGHHPTLGAHKKFTNYSFDKAAFVQLVADAAESVRSNPYYKAAWKDKWGSGEDEKVIKHEL